MKRILVLLAVGAVMVSLFAQVATAQYYGGGGGGMASPPATASPTATATASPTATATASPLPKTGGPPLTGPVTLLASLALMVSGVGALLLLRRSVS